MKFCSSNGQRLEAIGSCYSSTKNAFKELVLVSFSVSAKTLNSNLASMDVRQKKRPQESVSFGCKKSFLHKEDWGIEGRRSKLTEGGNKKKWERGKERKEKSIGFRGDVLSKYLMSKYWIKFGYITYSVNPVISSSPTETKLYASL